MVGGTHARDGLNRLIDAEIDARNPRTAVARASQRSTLARTGGVALRGGARRLPRGRLPARPARALAVADPRRPLRRLSVPEAIHVALPPLARRLARSGAGRRLARGHRYGAVAGLGARRGRRALGRRVSTSSTRCSTSSTIGAKVWTPGRHASARTACSPARGGCTRPPSSLLGRRGLGPRPAFWYWLGVLRRRGAAALRALARATRRSPSAGRGVLHGQRRDQRRLLRVRRARRPAREPASPRAGCHRRAGDTPAHFRRDPGTHAYEILDTVTSGIPGIPWGHVDATGQDVRRPAGRGAYGRRDLRAGDDHGERHREAIRAEASAPRRHVRRSAATAPSSSPVPTARARRRSFACSPGSRRLPRESSRWTPSARGSATSATSHCSTAS